MRKKFTMLLASLLLGLGATNAQVTKYYKPGERKATFTAGEKVMFYNTALVLNDDRTGISQDRTGFLIGTTSFVLDKQKPKNAPIFSEKVGVFTVETVEDQSTYYKVNVKGANGYVGIDGAVNNANASTLCFHKWATVADNKKPGDDVASENATGEGFVKRTEITDSHNLWIVANDGMSTLWNGNQTSFTSWETGHPYAIYSAVEATTADLETALAAAKVSAVASLNDLAKVSIFSVDDAIAKVNAVTLSNDDLEAALNSIDAFVVEAMVSIDGKSVVFDNNGSGREGLSITANASKNKAYGTTSEGDETIWTIKTLADGSFKLYNFVTNKYLSTPGSNDNSANLVDEANAASYKFIVTDVNKAALVSGSQMLHQRNAWSPNYDLINWYDLNDGASLWTLTEKVIKVSREQYDLATAAKASLPYAIQQAYGLVTDASKYYSNYKSDAEGSYAALLDNVESSYFHSAYNSEPGDGSGVHYIQADLGEGNSIDEFYFYMKPRSGNGNNRPKNITVSGSNDNVTYTPIKDITTTLDGTMAPYMSEKLGTDGTNYRYIRLTVASTNTSTVFFTLSELYFFSATADVTNLVNSYNAFATLSITSEAMASAAQALVNAETTLALANIKKEVAALLSANESNHAAAPALGQYTTEAYNALNAAYVAADATQESLEAAIAAFKKSLNAPVYFITSKHNGYAAGSAIYYDGAWKWKKANKFDRQMWMTIPGYTEANVPVVDSYDAAGTSYAICDYLTGTKMRGKDVQIVKVADWEGAYNLQYNANAESTDAAQHAKDNKQLVNWKPGTKDDAQASVWGVEYIGNTYDLDKLTDEHISALADMQAAYSAKVRYADVVIGDGIGQYQGNKDALVAALEAAEAISGKSLVELATMSVDDILAAKDAINNAEALVINQPAAGFYRIKSMNAKDANKKGKYWQSNEAGNAMELSASKDEKRSIVYVSEDFKFLSYGCGDFLNHHTDIVAVADGKSWNVMENASAIGTYALDYPDDGNWCLSDWTGGATYGHNDANAAWIFEEVTTLPVAVSAAGWGTFYTPVAVTVPTTVKAYTITAVGEKATLTQVEGTVPAGTGLILEGEKGTHNFAIATEDDAEDFVRGLLQGTAAKTYVTAAAGTTYYVLAKPEGAADVALYKAKLDKNEDTAFLNGANKVYLPVTTEQGAPAMFAFTRGDEENTTGIESVEANEELVIFDLAGRRVQKMEKGIYIVNGKKVVIK